MQQTFAISFKLGLRCEVLLEHRTVSEDLDYHENGNILLERLFVANIHSVPVGTNMNMAIQAVTDEISKKGGKHYIIPGAD